jgi:glyoxylase-like metal-dependent hydrolase (beta-lactamase superfamily II)
VVNSHNHFDHVGGNWEFDTVYGYPSPLSRQRADIGYTPALLDPMLGADSLAKPLPANFTSNSFTIQPWHYSPLETYKEPTMTKNEVGLRLTGQAFDLGDRVLEVLHTPGHTQDSIMLWDRTHRILFTGDTVYPAALYAHYGCPEFGYSDPETYARTMQDVAYLATELDCLCCSHNIAVFDPNLLIQVAKGFADIRQNLIEGTLGPDCLLRYDFVDFAIIMNPPSANIKLA